VHCEQCERAVKKSIHVLFSNNISKSSKTYKYTTGIDRYATVSAVIDLICITKNTQFGLKTCHTHTHHITSHHNMTAFDTRVERVYTDKYWTKYQNTTQLYHTLLLENHMTNTNKSSFTFAHEWWGLMQFPKQRNINSWSLHATADTVFHAAHSVKLKCSNDNITWKQYVNIILSHTLTKHRRAIRYAYFMCPRCSLHVVAANKFG